MRCPECGSVETEVLDTRLVGEMKRRRRQCPQGHRYATLEMLSVVQEPTEPKMVQPPMEVQPWAERLLRSLDCVGVEGGKSAGEVAV